MRKEHVFKWNTLEYRYDIFVESFVICPYCDPNHMAYPNMEEAVRGYDVPMGNPNPGRGDSDPGIRNQIFNPMVRNSDGYYKLDDSFVSANTQIKVGRFFNENSGYLSFD